MRHLSADFHIQEKSSKTGQAVTIWKYKLFCMTMCDDKKTNKQQTKPTNQTKKQTTKTNPKTYFGRSNSKY